MEELIELIIRLIARSMQGPKQTNAPLTPQRVDPPNRAVMQKKIPGARRVPGRAPGRPPGRRISPPPIMMARPIVTATTIAPMAATASTGTAHAVPAKSIAATAAAASVDKKPSANAATLRRWMNPTTLRQQFMLTEIFQPPLALRESHTRH
jgi:hypothetical protein